MVVEFNVLGTLLVAFLMVVVAVMAVVVMGLEAVMGAYMAIAFHVVDFKISDRVFDGGVGGLGFRVAAGDGCGGDIGCGNG